MIVLAVLAGVACVWFLIPGQGPGMKRLLPRSRSRRPVVSPWRMGFLVGIVGLVAGVFAQPVTVVAGLLMVGITVAWVVQARMGQKRALKQAKEVARAAQVLESLLALGHVPISALSLASGECPIFEPAVAAVRMGGDPWEIMEHMSKVPGQAGLVQIGQAWRVCQVSGASMRESLETVRKNLEEDANTAGVIAGELAGPRATGQILAVLPLFGMGMAYAVGANPTQFFTEGVLGRSCLLLGIGLGCLGLVWSELVAQRASGFGRQERKT